MNLDTLHPGLLDTASPKKLAWLLQAQIQAARGALYQLSLSSPDVIDLVEMDDGTRVDNLIRANCRAEPEPARMTAGKYERWEGRFI